MSSGITIADLFVNVGFTPDTKSLDGAAAKAKNKFESISKGVKGIAAGVKGMFALSALSHGIGAVRGIASSFMQAADNADNLYRMAKRAKISVEQLQRNQGKSVIMSKEEIDSLRNVKIFFGEINAWKNKIVSGAFKMIAPYINKARAFLKGNAGKKIIETYKKFFSQIWETLKPVFALIQNIVSVLLENAPKLWKAVEPLFKTIGELSSGLFGFLGNGLGEIKGILEYLFNYVKDFVEATVSMIKASIEFFRGTFSNASFSIKPFLRSLLNIFKMLMNAIKSIYKAISNIFQMILGKGKGAMDFIIKAVKMITYPIRVAAALIEDILAIFDDSVEGYFENTEGFKNFVPKIMAAKDWLMNAFKEAWEFWSDFFSDLGKWFGDFKDDWVLGLNYMIAETKSFFSDFKDDWVTGFKYISGSIEYYFSEMFEGIKASLDWIFSMAGKIKDSITDALQAMNNMVSKIPLVGKFFAKKEESGKDNIGTASDFKKTIKDSEDFAKAKFATSLYTPYTPISERAPISNSVSNDNRTFAAGATTNNTNITVNVNGAGDKKEISKAVEMGINQSRLANMR